MTTRPPPATKSVILLGSALALCGGAAGFFAPRSADGAVASGREDADSVIFGSAVLRASLRTETENRLAAGRGFVQASRTEETP
ncbi:MAG TPA: hypothetical protein VMJ31_00590, partial [Methylocystis sp.]|nr:hypothetical protein [Methylocystis sp.]